VKIFSISLIILVLAFGLLAPIPPTPQHLGDYNTLSHLMYCVTPVACLHEVGHRLDQSLGYPSQRPSYSKVLQMYLLVELHHTMLEIVPVSVLDLTYRSDSVSTNLKEIYAYMFAWADGKLENIPDGLRPFYGNGYPTDQLRPDIHFYYLP
jgi:hypothetical protein